MTPREAEDQLTKIAERVITPDFLNQLEVIGGFVLGWGLGDLLKQITIVTIILWVVGIGFFGISWYVKKNFEWKEEKEKILVDRKFTETELIKATQEIKMEN